MIQIFSVLAIIGCGMALVPNLTVISIGRFLYGFSSGVFCSAGPKILNETIPTHLWDFGFGCSTNISINFFVFTSMLLGIGMPQDPEVLKTTSYWQVVYGMPIVLILLQMALLAFIHTEDSLLFHVAQHDKEPALRMI